MMSGTQSQIQKAINQIQDKGPLPDIDFTQHQLENGYTISTQERVVKEVCVLRLPVPSRIYDTEGVDGRQVQAPAMSIPTDAQFFSKTDPSKPDVAFLKNHFYREGRLSEEHALYILEKGTEILRAEPNLLYVDAPVTGTSCICTPFFSFL